MKYITIGRQYGSGGRLIGKELAESLGIPCYDSELIQLASVKSGISAEYVEALDEKGTASFFHALMLNASPMGAIMPNYFNMTTNDQLFFLQSDIIKELAKKGSAIFVGRCADYILEGSKALNIFIHAPKDYRIKALAARNGIDESDAAARIQKIDKKRKAYYNHYTSKEWGDVGSYHLAIDSSKFEQAIIVDFIIKAFNNL
ncbi:MAG: cytidylate kinase-like family protein [Clostridia bacterium]|nr:cytidylate kinase-like family protein [Clostridia bacterium]